ncbi:MULTISPECIES: TauD/TfdA family dioxygenase [Rhodomicrobium]|uniref:TauD/TfdA dioxygenase family protein n=1 Tax=Rhodomicrobium TaxID=1068 RepID=UPI000B4B92C7|nr:MULTISPECIES: TauD/TfdA family dioxygenase [Rhodomicrobium]
MSFEIRNLDAPLGAEILGLDLSEVPHEAELGHIRQALAERGVLVFRDQSRLTPEEHIAFSRTFGPLQIHIQHHFHHPQHPEILVVSNVVENGKPIGLADAGRYWHSDLSYVAEPSLGSLLHAQELPDEGGDTLFANQVAAYESLPAELRERIDGLQAVHSYEARNRAQQAVSGDKRPGLTEAQRASVPPVTHPVVRVHPESGRKALFVNEGFTTHIVGLPEDESRALLEELFTVSVAERFIYRHRWQPHDLVFWDNRQTVHLATPFPQHYRRKLYRTTVQGDVPAGPN